MDKVSSITYGVGMASSSFIVHPSNVLARSRRKSRRTRANIFGLHLGDVAESIKRVKEGFDYSALARFHRATGLPLRTIADLIRIPPRTLMRRKAAGRLRPDES